MDFVIVIVSAGAAGSVLANRLSEDRTTGCCCRSTAAVIPAPWSPSRSGSAIWIVANSSPAWMRSFGLCPCRLAGTPEPKPAPARDGALAIMPGLGPQSIL